MCFPAHGLAAGNNARAADVDSTESWRVADVELQSGGLLVGQLLDAAAKPLAGADVSILSRGNAIASTHTDASGLFAVAGLRGGIHQVNSGDAAQVCRVWAPGTAPPRTASSLQIVAGEDVVRGQWGPPPGNRFLKKAKVWLTNPFVVGGIVAAAVAIPVALHNADDDGPNS
jgi:hypothetical protein